MTSTPDLLIPSTLAEIDYSEAIAFGGLMLLIIFWVLFSNIRKMYQTRQREQTRREIAAYVAEGSISPTDARHLMGNDDSEFEKKIADAVSWGLLSTKKAEQLMKAMREDRASRDPASP
ncbi:MAG: hypothetical protein ACF8MJ_04815 [Phycisphaerales bacterium JB050]